ncbi:GntR family transcriptional regulator [Alicyclobacillus tolerans]|uniref:GntR family transcriptional regulator n=1 Tax=Alicyclobacillus tolerans TaxID=90970 RepID=UPI001F452476|nr:GntR family transcriptional regulator [Alicyclobacillus tolerans]MCF8565159.1 GntR family transcriptional regulator [Alicyclobacillus tolerans]
MEAMNMAESVDGLKTVAQLIAEKIEEGILNGNFPLGMRLVQTQLSEMFGVSRLPVRDALHILEQKGLVVQIPRKGVVIRPVNLKEIENLFELREVIESHAASVSIPHLTPGDIQELEMLINQQATCQDQVLHTIDIDEQFHDKLLCHCENEDLTEILHSIWRRIRVYRAYVHKVERWNDESILSHKNILQAIQNGDSNGAVQYFKASVEQTKNRFVELISALKP